MSVVLRVRIPATGLTKAIRFTDNMSVHESCKTIVEKLADGGGSSGGKDHGLYKPLTEDSTIKGGKWLKPDKTLAFYDLKSNDLVEFRKRHDILKIKLLDGTVKTLLTDTSLTVDEVVVDLAKRIQLKNPEEYSLQIEGANDWMKKEGAVLEQLDTVATNLVLKKRYFVNDANVDRDDPVQLHLVYIQSRDDILQGKHPTQRDEALQLAALQCQIDGGNVILSNPQLNIKSILASIWQKEKGIDKEIIKEWKKLTGMSEMNAKYRYVQFCRSLKTYGLTIFHVKDRPKNTKKLTPFMLGFTRDAILRLTLDCKVEKTWPLIHLKRWAASSDTFTMDFGSHESDYITVITEEGEAISQLIAGYIDILLKKQKDTTVVIEDDRAPVAEVTNVGTMRGSAVTTSFYGSSGSFGQSVSDLASAPAAIAKMKSALLVERVPIPENSALSPAQKKQQMIAHQKNVESLSSKMASLITQGSVDASQLKSLGKQMATGLENLMVATRAASAVGLDESGELIESMKSLSDSISKLLTTSEEASKNPNDPKLKDAVRIAQFEIRAGFAKIEALQNDVHTDPAYQHLFVEAAKAVTKNANALATVSSNFALQNPMKGANVANSREAVQAAASNLDTVSALLAPTVTDNKCKAEILAIKDSLNNSVRSLAMDLKGAGLGEDDSVQLMEAIKGIQTSLISLVNCVELPDIGGGTSAEIFSSSSQSMLQAANAVMASAGKSEAIKQNVSIIQNSLESMKVTIQAVADTASTQKRMAQEYKFLSDATTKLFTIAPDAIARPTDQKVQTQLRAAAQQVAQATEVLINDGGEKVAVAGLFNSAKEAAAATMGLSTCVASLNGCFTDFKVEQDLTNMAKTTSDALNSLVAALKDLPSSAEATEGNIGTESLLTASEQFAPVAMKLVALSKSAVPKINSPDLKKEVAFEADNALKVLQKFVLSRKATKATVGQVEILQATEQFDAAAADLDSAIISVQSGMVDIPTMSREDSLAAIQGSIREIQTIAKTVSRKFFLSLLPQLCEICKDSPEEIGSKLKELAMQTVEIVSSGKSLVGTLGDSSQQRQILSGIKISNGQLTSFFQAAKAVASSPNDGDLMKLLADSSTAVANSMTSLLEMTTTVIPTEIEQHLKASSADIEELAEKELSEASQIIANAVAKISQFQQAVSNKRKSSININLEELQFTESVMQSVHAIGRTTATLVNAATSVQKDYNKLVKSHTSTTTNPYKRDPTWAKGLISSSQQVAGAVTHLVDMSDKVIKGDLKEESLIVAAKAVAAETAKLVTASSVKNNFSNHSKLNDAAKQVNAATKALQEAAVAAADFKREEEDGGKFSLPTNKIQELNEQVEILKLERELERRRAALFANRKKEYEKTDDKNEVPETTGKVMWRKSVAFEHKPTGLEGLLNQ